MVRVGVLLDVQILLHRSARIREKRPLRPHGRAEFLEHMVVIGRDGCHLRVGDGDLRIERRKLEVLLMLLRTVVSA
jgi:hypothetical protein